MPLLVLEVALHSHGPEQKPAEVDAAEVAGQPKLEGAGVARRGSDRIDRPPRRRDGTACAVAHGESDALVLGVGQECDDAALLSLDVDLNRVLGGIAVKARAVALVRGGVVHSRLGEVEDGGGWLWREGRHSGRELGDQLEEYNTHFLSLTRAS
jgi:hypothetical protein